MKKKLWQPMRFGWKSKKTWQMIARFVRRVILKEILWHRWTCCWTDVASVAPVQNSNNSTRLVSVEELVTGNRGRGVIYHQTGAIAKAVAPFIIIVYYKRSVVNNKKQQENFNKLLFIIRNHSIIKKWKWEIKRHL